MALKVLIFEAEIWYNHRHHRWMSLNVSSRQSRILVSEDIGFYGLKSELLMEGYDQLRYEYDFNVNLIYIKWFVLHTAQ